MGNLTVGLDDKTEEKIRKMAKEKFEGNKGSIAKVITEAVEVLEKYDKKEAARKQAIYYMENAPYVGKILIKHRDELYDRK
ncbi:MAG: hypothetical protein Q7S21_03465 [archaeon]|nr:hypothetical protein [archaeon]